MFRWQGGTRRKHLENHLCTRFFPKNEETPRDLFAHTRRARAFSCAARTLLRGCRKGLSTTACLDDPSTTNGVRRNSCVITEADCYVCYPKGCAAPCCVRCECDTRESLSKLERTSPQRKMHVTSKPPVGGVSVVTLIRTDISLLIRTDTPRS